MTFWQYSNVAQTSALVGLGTQTLKGSKTSLATVLLMYKIHVTIIINFSVTKKLEYKHRLNKSN